MKYKQQLVCGWKRYSENDLLVLFVLYSFSWSFLLVNPAVLWDDWVLYNMSESVVKDVASQMGKYLSINLNYYMINHMSLRVCHSIIFVAYFIASASFFKTLQVIKMRRNESLVVVSLAMLIPFNELRGYLSAMHYTLGFMLMSLGVYFFSVYIYRRFFSCRILALLCFGFALNMLHSNYIFIPACIFLILFVRHHNPDLDFKENLKYSAVEQLKLPDFVCLVIGSWIIKSVFFVPYGEFQGYNTVSLLGVIAFPYFLARTILRTLDGILEGVLEFYPKNEVEILIFLALIGFFLLLFRSRGHIDSLPKKETTERMLFFPGTKIRISVLFCFGFFLFAAGAFPYNVVGSIPEFFSAASRHQILLGIGLSLILFEMIRMVPRRFRHAVLAVFLAGCTLTNFNYNMYFLRTHLWRSSLAYHISQSQEMKNGRNFWYVNKTRFSVPRFFVLGGYSKKIFGDEKRLITNESLSVKFWERFADESWNLKDISYKGKWDYNLIVSHGSFSMTNWHVLKMVYLDIFNSARYVELIKKIVTIQVVPRGR
jgi:hypothetical protein